MAINIGQAMIDGGNDGQDAIIPVSDTGTGSNPDTGAGSGNGDKPKPLGTSDGTGNTITFSQTLNGVTYTDQGAYATAYAAYIAAQNTAATIAAGQAQTNAANALAAANKAIAQDNAQQLLASTFSGYGLEGTGLSNAIVGLLQKNYDAPTIQALIEDPASAQSSDPSVKALATAWNARFPGNAQRIANKQNPLSPAEYIATENSYRNILNAAGLPKGFYDSREQMGNLIANQIAPTELQDRITTAAKSIANQDPFYTNTLQQYYGLSPSDMIAHALDPNTALPLLQRQAAAATFGAAGARQGISVDQATANQYAALGVTQQQAEQGFTSIGTALPTEQKLASIYGGAGTQFGTAGEQQANLTAATFGGAGAAQAELQLKKLQQQEVSAFSGSSGVDKNSLGVTTTGTF